ncbi:cellulose synthase D-like protein, putative [Medicago truncatula]|uniref:Cellulose synthase D-like protein, putative n=1 Tax=Medicago truncatula TaxID=3880 RepID=A0A072U8E3_MEDTR|nr:cellulose synthase D-like protein, putative [Medicago truncatula]
MYGEGLWLSLRSLALRIKGRKRLLLARSQTNEFDAQCLFEIKGTYGYGSSMWPKDSENATSSSSCSDWMGGDPNVFKEKSWRPFPESEYSCCNSQPLLLLDHDQLPKLFPINRVADLDILKEKFETPSPAKPNSKSDPPEIDMLVSTADPEKERVTLCY